MTTTTTTNNNTINLCLIRKGQVKVVKTFTDLTEAREALRTKHGGYFLQYWRKRA